MFVGQTLFSVLKGTEHRAEAALLELDRAMIGATGLKSHRMLRSFGMSPIGSALHDEAREAELGAVHFVIQTEWDSLDLHDDFYRSEAISRAYDVLSSILVGGPYEVLYEALEDRVAV
jgi:hypothetical protein